MARPQNRTRDSQPTPLTPCRPDVVISAPGLTAPSSQPLARRGLPPSVPRRDAYFPRATLATASISGAACGFFTVRLMRMSVGVTSLP